MGCTRQVRTILERRLVARHEQHLVETKLLPDRLREQKMPEMRRVESPAEHSHALCCHFVSSLEGRLAGPLGYL